MMNFKKYILAVSVLTAGMIACGNDNFNGGDPIKPTNPTSGDVKIYTTTSSMSQDFEKTFVNFNKTASMSPKTIKIDESKTFQTMDGFGSAITGSTAYRSC